MTSESLASVYLETATRSFRGLKTLAEKAIAQLGDDELHQAPDPESNSVAVLMNHISGNLLSRWTDFLSTDGEKPDRDRDGEFVDAGSSREQLLDRWAAGWKVLLDTLATLGEDDLLKTVTIRGEPHTVVLAIERQVVHYAYHAGQIVYLAKQIRSADWKNLSIPKQRPEDA
ncbi:MAG TPA: DUF1572 family protein [Thermoanaerobaculia bacterium]|nr:DUF1572 family protein [Thermoanaerobaculia bacterium]